jgi:hypothetical protein
MYVTVTARNQDLAGVVYRLPLTPQPLAADLEEFHVFPFTPFGPEGPDGIAFGPSGNLYVALAMNAQQSTFGGKGGVTGGDVRLSR